MIQEGLLYTCDRCGLTGFKAKTGTQFNVIDGYCEESPVYDDSKPFWESVKCYPISGDPSKSVEMFKRDHVVAKTLCPQCQKELIDVLRKFWRIKEE